MKISIIAYSFIISNLFHCVRCLQCYESVGNDTFFKTCLPKYEEHEMCFSTRFGAQKLCIRGCSYEIMRFGPYKFSLNCSEATCMDGIGCCCKGDLCNNYCFNGATTIQYSILLSLLLGLMMFEFLC